MRKIYLLQVIFLAIIFFSKNLQAQTPVPMSSQPGLSYTENFADIANWTNGFAAGIGANRFGSVVVNATGTIPDGVRTSTATSTFSTGTAGGVQRGSAQSTATQSILLLSTGSPDNTSSCAIDFFMDFTGVNAGKLSFDWDVVFNSTGDRKGSLRVYASIDGTSFSEITAAQVLNFTNNVAGSGNINNITLPASFNNSATARLRFYYHNGSGGASGSRPKISIDNLNVTALPAGNAVSIAAGSNAAEAPSPTAGNFTLTFNPATTGSTSVDYAYTGTADFGTDYTITYSAGTPSTSTATGTLTVPSGVTSVTVTVTPINDATVEGTETVITTLSNPTNSYSIGTASATINITDDDVIPTVTASAGIAPFEPATNGSFTVTLSDVAPAGGVTVTYTLNGTATLNTDYSDPQSGTITIPAGSTTGTIDINVIDDNLPEADETINITLNTATSPFLISGGTASLTLTSDDITPISLTGSVYTQNFNSLVATGTGTLYSIIPSGWGFAETGTAANTTYSSGTGSSTSGDTYSFGSAASAERAFGTLQTGSLVPSIGAYFTNNTGSLVTALKINYTGEEWRLGAAGRTDQLHFQISTDATNLTTGTWTDVTQLDFATPFTTTVGAVDGNAVANQTAISFTITGLSISNGNSFYIRWIDENISGSDDGLAVDDFSIETNPVDVTAPIIVTLTPANSSTNVAINLNATINFDETVLKGTGNIVIKKTSDNSIFQTISIASATVNVSGANVTFPLNTLAANTSYYIEIDAGGFKDQSNNNFAGITGNSTWTFTTGTLLLDATFTTCAGMPSNGFSQFSVTGPQLWDCTTFGRDAGNLPLGSAPYGLQMNGFSGTNIPNEDWLISSSYDLTATGFPLLSFWSRTKFNGPPLKLMVSTNYPGTGNPTGFTWTEINGKFPAQTTDAWTLSNNINLSAFKTANTTFAFVYLSSNDEGARWTLDDIQLSNSATPPPASLTKSTTDIGFGYAAAASSVDKTFLVTGNDITSDIAITATSGFLLSENVGGPFLSAITLLQAASNNITRTVYARFTPSVNNQNYTGTYTLSTAGVADQTIALSGTSIDPINTLEVVNWNLEWFGSTTLGPTNDAQQQANVQTILQNIGADLYALVEVVDESRLASVVSNMPGYSYVICNYGSHTNTNEGGATALSEAQKEAFVYKTSVFSNISTTALVTQGINSVADLTNPAYNYFASGRFPYMMTADVTLNGATKQIRFVLLHAKANTAPTATSYARRKSGSDTLHYTLNTLYPNDNIVLLGDINDDLDQTITDGINPPTTSYSAFVNDNANFYAPTLALSLAGKKSTVSYNDMIDHVILSNEMSSYYMSASALVKDDVTSLVTSYGSTTTDHYPIFTRYAFDAIILPVQLLNFAAVKDNAFTKITWATTQEINTHHFILERSVDGGNNWKEIANVAASGNNNTVINYTSTDLNPAKGVNLYRLKVVDIDDKFTVSAIRKVNFEIAYTFSIFPNPASSAISISSDYNSGVNKMAVVEVINNVSQVLVKANINLAIQPSKVEIGQLNPGIYFLKINMPDGTIRLEKFIKQ